MNTMTNFNKKLIYGLMIVGLFAAMFPYSYWLTREKKRRDLGEAAIGQIDTGSFMMKLFLLGGFRGIVADLLWVRAEEYKRAHDWDKLASTVDLITKLQPHFLAIWTYQGWNHNTTSRSVGRATRLSVDQEGDPVRPGGREEEQALPRLALGYRLVLLPQARLLRRVDHPAAIIPRR